MKSEELSEILHGFLEILKLYPGKSVGFIFEDLRRLKENETKGRADQKIEETTSEAVSDDERKIRIDKLYDSINELSISEIEEKLRSEDLFPSMAYIRYFAKKAGVDVSTRQSRANSIHTIKSHLDRMRIDSTISKRNE